MAKDVNNTQVVTEQDVNKADVVNQQDVQVQVVDEQKQDEVLADGTKVDKTVPYSRFQEATDRAKEAEDKASFAQRETEILKQQAIQQQQPQQTQQPGSTFEQAMQQLGLTEEDLTYSGANQVKVANLKAQLDTAQNQQQQVFNANQQFMNSHSDFTQVVGSVNPATGVITAWSQEALLLQQNKPYLNFNSAQGAYQAVMDERKLAELETKAKVNEEQQNRQKVDISSQPLGASAAGGGGAGDVQNQRLLSRAETQEIEDKIERGEI